MSQQSRIAGQNGSKEEQSVLSASFDADQERQIRAVKSVTRRFEGLPRYAEACRLDDDIVANLPPYQEPANNWLLDHLRAVQQENQPFGLIAYDGAQLSRLRHFATTNTVTVLLVARDAFSKATNNRRKALEKLPGERRSFQFIQETRPILILDEPQNMESEQARQTLRAQPATGAALSRRARSSSLDRNPIA